MTGQLLAVLEHMERGRRLIELLRSARVSLLLAFDAGVLVTAYVVSAVLRYELSFSGPRWGWVLALAAVALAVHILVGWFVKLHRGRVTVASVDETVLLSLTVAAGAVAAQMVNMLGDEVRVGRSVPVAAGFAALALMLVGRAWWRITSHHIGYVSGVDRRRTIVVGAGESGHSIVRSMRTDPESPFEPVALLDDDLWKRHLHLDGVPVRGRVADLASVAEAQRAKVVVVAIPSAAKDLLSAVDERARPAGLEVKVLPCVSEMFGGRVSIRDVRDINLADLLGRAAIDTDVESIAQFLKSKRVLVTGAGGSIGSELCRQIMNWEPAELMMLDRDESALHGLQLIINGHGFLDTRDVILCDIRDAAAVHGIFVDRRPQVVLHAAALKHLPMLEQYPLEAIKTNVIGTVNVLEAAKAVGVQRFVNISTDKAADPTSALGLSKRVAERLTADVAGETRGTFISVRFGNVLGSRGSVLSTWTAQIGQGGPVTVTHPDVTRYFMTVHEACQLVLQAGAIGRDGEVLLLDMGKPVRLEDVARQLIAQSGKDIDILYTGLRAGEKLEEALIAGSEQDSRPFHELVSHVTVPALVRTRLSRLDASMSGDDARRLLRKWCTAESETSPLVRARV